MLHVVVMLAVPVFCATDDDPIKGQLDQARDAYNERVDRARSKLLDGIAKKADEAASKGDLKGVKTIGAQKDQFEADGTLPTAPQLVAAVSAYKTEVRAAADAFAKGLRKARDEYTKARKIDQAEGVEVELQQFEADQQAAKKQVLSTAVNRKEPFQPDTRWTGTRYPRTGAAQPWEMTIDSRVNNKVKGRISITRIDGKTSSYAFEGTARGPRIEFITEKSGSFQQHFVGKYSGNEVAFEWDGMTDKGYRDVGTAKLEQKRK
jgi:hypothetical protein